MNTGQRLVALSGLASGTALAHFAAITQSVGAGGGLLIAHRATAVATQRKAHITAPPSTNELLDYSSEPSVSESDETQTIFITSAQLGAAMKTSQSRAYVVFRDEQVTVTKSNPATVVSTFSN